MALPPNRTIGGAGVSRIPLSSLETARNLTPFVIHATFFVDHAHDTHRQRTLSFHFSSHGCPVSTRVHAAPLSSVHVRLARRYLLRVYDLHSSSRTRFRPKQTATAAGTGLQTCQNCAGILFTPRPGLSGFPHTSVASCGLSSCIRGVPWDSSLRTSLGCSLLQGGYT